MKKPPQKRNERLLTMNLLFMSYGIIGMIQAAAGFFAYFYVLTQGGWHWGDQFSFSDLLYQKAITAFFFSIIVVQIADVLICRVRRASLFKKRFFSNHLVLVGIIFELLIGLFIVYMSFSHTVFNTHHLNIVELLLALPFALIIFFGDELRKYYVQKWNDFVQKYLTW